MAHYASSKKAGNIASAFVSDNDTGVLPERYRALKQELLSNCSPRTIQESWNRLIKSFEDETKEIKRLGPEVVPQIDFSEITKNGGSFPDTFAKEVRKRGCVVVRNVVGVNEALKYKEDVNKYIEKHPGKIVGFPEENPQVWEIYWSKSQIEARSHPNFVATAQAVNSLWRAEPETLIDFSTNLTYCDRLRIRQPGDTSFALAEHIDGGSVERWEDPEYRKCYSHILNGEWEKHDAFDATHRVNATMDMYNCSGGCSMFRTFQGWMSLSNVKPGGGTLRLCPLIKQSSAYLILRPLLQDLADSTKMVGAIPGVQQHILKEFHPHIVESVVSIPEVHPGDCVFWHCDMIHAVEECCKSPTDSSVLYIPSTPVCSKNAEYLCKQRYAFENGLSPQDFPLNNCEIDFEDRAFPKELSELGKLGMGFSRLALRQESGVREGANKAIVECNEILFG